MKKFIIQNSKFSPLLHLVEQGAVSADEILVIGHDNKYQKKILNSLYGDIIINNSSTTDDNAIGISVSTIDDDITAASIVPADTVLDIIDITNSKQKDSVFSSIATKKGMDCKILDVNLMFIGLPHDRVVRVAIIGSTNVLRRISISKATPIDINSLISKNVDKKYYLSSRMIKYAIGSNSELINRSIAVEISKNMHKMHSIKSDNYIDINGIRRLTPIEVLRLNGFNIKDDANIGISDTQAYSFAAVSTPPILIEMILSSVFDMLDDPEDETFMLNGKKYIHDKILSFEPLIDNEKYVKAIVMGKRFSFLRKNLKRVKTSKGKIVYVIINKSDNDILSYLMDNMSHLATRDVIDGKKWDELLECEE